jgi:hypothetical protein
MTLPQVVFSWAKKREYDAAQTKDHILGTVIAIGGAMSKEGGKRLKSILMALDGPGMTDADLMDSLDDEARLVMFGSRKLGRTRSTDQD